MQPHFAIRPYDRSLAMELAGARRAGLVIHWLGQAGFVIDAAGRRIVIDPYLSDSLAQKYRGTATPHDRMAPPPLAPDALGDVSIVLCTHQHSDHLDGETLKQLAYRLPQLKFVVPAAARNIAMERIGVGADRLIPMDAGSEFALDGATVRGFRAAHETLERDGDGHYRFLGYGIDTGGHRLFHSGDTIPFDGQVEDLRAYAPHIALLPVNGRSAALRQQGIAGNLSIREAIDLATRAGVPAMIAHHYGMFAFNTADPEAIDRAAASAPLAVFRATLQGAVESVLD